MTVFDWVVIGILTVSAAIGAWRGLVGEALAILGWIVALTCAWLFGTTVGAQVFAGISEPALRAAAGMVTVVLLVLIGMAVIRWLLRKLLKALGLSLTDRLLGVLFGLARGAVIVVLLVMLGGLTSAPRAPWWAESTLAPPLQVVVLALRPALPSELGKRIRF